MKKFILWVTFATLFCTCKKDDQDCPPDLPCATQVGANTFGCYINGKPWVAEIAYYLLDPTLHKIEAEYDETGYGNDFQNRLRITASKYDSVTSGFMTFYIWPVVGIGSLNSGTHYFSASGNISDLSISQGVFAIDLDTIMDYTLKITHWDVEANTMSGLFSFRGISSTDTVAITDGRFDVKYSPY